MKNRMVHIATCAVCLAVVGCASEERRITGFIRDYSILTPHASIAGALVYWNPEIDPKQYKAVIVDPVEVDFVKRSAEIGAKPEDVAAFRRFVTDELTKAISKHATIVTEPGPNVLRCRLQVANLQLTRSIGKPGYPWPRPEYALGTANIEAQAQDSISGELVVAYVSPPGGVEIYTPFPLESPPDSWEPAKSIIRHRIVTWTDNAARFFETELNEIQTAAKSPVESRQRSVIYGPQATH